MCGNCSNGKPCHHVDGTCPNGCDAGMYSEKCDLGNMRIKFSFNIFFYIKFVISKPFSTENLKCNLYNSLIFKYQLDNMFLDETLSMSVFQYLHFHNYTQFAVLMRIYQYPWSMIMKWKSHTCIKHLIYFCSSLVW